MGFINPPIVHGIGFLIICANPTSPAALKTAPRWLSSLRFPLPRPLLRLPVAVPNSVGGTSKISWILCICICIICPCLCLCLLCNEMK